MLFNIIKFELSYRLKRPATFIYFGILFFMAFLFLTTDIIQIGGGTGNVFRNSPYTINLAVCFLGVFSTMICSALMGVPVFRDFDNKFHEIYFSTPVKKFDYLLGRFFWLIYHYCVGFFRDFVGHIFRVYNAFSGTRPDNRLSFKKLFATLL